MLFYLGTHEVSWLARTDVPLFVSARRLRRQQRVPRAKGRWALDSGGFSELSLHGRWETHPGQYIEETYRWRDAVGQLDWAAIQDWMCEPFMLEKTGLSLREHQARTVDSWALLTLKAGDLPWAPVLQGWHAEDYLRHAEDYARAGCDLRAAPAVGVGSVCRRQATGEAEEIFAALAPLGLRLHGFGLKLGGLARSASLLTSADSLAWSFQARRNAGMPGCTHRTCANCLAYALHWRKKVLARTRAGLAHGLLFSRPVGGKAESPRDHR